LLLCRDPDEKARGARLLDESRDPGSADRLAQVAGIPCGPPHPVRVAHTRLTQRSMKTGQGRAALLRALTHIGLNASKF
jgi:uncharacterized ferritin-like protein (DUF455 family)